MEGEFQVSDAPRSVPLSTCTATIETLNGDVTVTIAGELDMADAERVGEVLADAARAARSSLRVHLAELAFADSSALKALLLGSMICDERGIAFLIVDPHSSVRRLLHVTGLTEKMTIVGGPE